MAREFLAMFHGGYQDEVIRYNSGTLFLLGIIFLSLMLISMIIFSCGVDDSYDQHARRAPPPIRASSRYTSRHGGGSTAHSRKSERRISGLGGDGGGDGGGG
ncbi:hypothetical protein PHAVU_005G094700 [Phaseolus vulgaris]|uniref:Transmembrane protein n=1 Tax=Phaseolus vulgaris TaxID=3885 RepID=V7BUP9_PHAVU|nr:hypothetical protein PHAVU_005G094700g [Phaseolus vulgaris]ESW21727.1 hypothetical protein PHAVU_005G094700g [Phaseolus vulgaris]